MTEDLGRGMSDDGLRGSIRKRDLILHIGGDDSAGNGCENRFHQILEPGHFFERMFERGE